MYCLVKQLSSLTILPRSYVATRNGSIFMKKQKKMDPEVAKQRENRRRKRLEKEIRQMQKHSKKPKPIDEMTIDVKSSKNLKERQRVPIQYTEEEEDEFAISLKDYTKSRNHLQRIDRAWVTQAVSSQTKALNELKKLDPDLYSKAIQPDYALPLQWFGPPLTATVKGYAAPDGDYIDTTRTWN